MISYVFVVTQGVVVLNSMSFPRSIVAWINSAAVIPRLDRGIQFKILKLLVL
ncbi:MULTISPECIES: hypothetical protein [spotted fever group]|uniref:hypothetical protein n=1 Tax=spotted fever group TaxID=114277 RepID=UPI0001A608D5|nr:MULTISPECIES: hypothetical protein [spotted fever group]EER22010.1 hypothetical protein REIS_1207 [Rickettsia endosymbiont of Ixodes scapularis]